MRVVCDGCRANGSFLQLPKLSKLMAASTRHGPVAFQ